MHNKKCSKCGGIKPLDLFCKDKHSPDGLSRQCKECRKKNWGRYYKNNGDELRSKYIAYYHENSDKKQLYRDENKDRQRKSVKAWSEKNKERIMDIRDRYRPTLLKKNNERYHSHYKYDPKFQLKRRMAKGIRRTLIDGKQGRHWESFVDYSSSDLVEHLKRKDPATWKAFENEPSAFHLDHIIPVDVFNFDSADQIDFKKCWDIKNLQLLPALENIVKSNKIDTPFQPSFNMSFG